MGQGALWDHVLNECDLPPKGEDKLYSRIRAPDGVRYAVCYGPAAEVVDRVVHVGIGEPLLPALSTFAD